MLLAILFGFLFGFIGSMPVAGPISFLVLRLVLEHRARHAWYVAAGAALAESGYALLAFWGLSTILVRYPMIVPIGRIFAVLLCLGLGVAMVRRRAPATPGEPRRRGNKRSLLSGFIITALNPTFIITWTAALAALNGAGIRILGPGRALPFAGAVLVGIVAWFSTLLWMLERFKERWSPRVAERFIRMLGVLLLVAGVWLGLGLL
jgi:threonine/homoserine/homoserine lactone efflux protein